MSDLQPLLWCEHDSVEACARALSEVVAGDLREAIRVRAKGTLALSGGSTPAPFLRHLASRELDWTRVEIFLVDERWCSHKDARSNYRMISRALAAGAARSARLVPQWRPDVSLADGATMACAEFGQVAPLDVLVLGMGTDGHTASWIPGAAGLRAAMEDTVNAMVPVRPTDGRESRLTMSRAMVSRAHIRYLHITGAAKRRVLNEALTPGSWEEFPIRGAFAGSTLRVYWGPEDET